MVIISIHAAREGGDCVNVHAVDIINISIHAAREGGDALAAVHRLGVPLFQSTPPVKAATKSGCNRFRHHRFQSTPPVKAATIILWISKAI